MIICLEDLFFYDLVKKCTTSGNFSLKTIFQKETCTYDGYKSLCSFFCEKFNEKIL